MYTLNYRLLDKEDNKWYHDTIETDDWNVAMGHFKWFSDMCDDDSVSDAHITLCTESHTCCRYTKNSQFIG